MLAVTSNKFINIDLGLRLDYFHKAYHQLGVNIVAFAYRGYSDSDGVPTEAGLKLDSHVFLICLMTKGNYWVGR